MSELDRMVDAVRAGRLSRRQFLQRGLALGLSVSAVGTLLAACGGGEDEPAPMNTTLPESITFFNWSDYLDPALKKKFETESGVTVNETYFDTNDDLLAKMRAGATGYDVICPGGYIASIMQKSDMLQPLDMSMIPSFSGMNRRCVSRSTTTLTSRTASSTPCPTCSATPASGSAPTR